MIRLVMLGRAGNNLFQYALGRVLARRHEVPLVLDGSWFNRDGWSQVSCLKRLPLQVKIVRRMSLGVRVLKKLTGKHYWEYRGVPVVREDPLDHSFDSGLLDAPDDCLLLGYFQSPKYFNGIEGELRNEIDLRSAVECRPGFRIPDGLLEENSVAVHVRRTDFTTLSEFQVCDLSYYRAAMERFRQRLASPRFFVFSDDPAWCLDIFRRADESVVDLPAAAGDPLHDLYLMSLARHHVIVNSSYSWWAAWLGKKDGQQVLCPPRWFSHGIKAPIGEKLCPGWEVVEAMEPGTPNW